MATSILTYQNRAAVRLSKLMVRADYGATPAEAVELARLNTLVRNDLIPVSDAHAIVADLCRAHETRRAA
jgi:hypothetical protein